MQNIRTLRNLENITNNLINGNIDDARKQSKKYSKFRLSMYFRQIKCWNFDLSVKAANFLKTGDSWQEYCDAK